MKWTSLRLGSACAVLGIAGLTGGCSGEKPKLPAAAGQAPSAPTSGMPEVVSGSLSWDAMEQTHAVSGAAEPAFFAFQMRNSSTESIVIEKVNVSCGCTTAETRPLPFTLEPGASESIKVSMSLAGKSGTVTKSVLVQSSRESWNLLVTAEMPPPASSRERNVGLATADRQAVFKGECAACHTRYAEDQTGYALYLGACAICHEAEHRAGIVPDLGIVKSPRDDTYWRQNIRDGRPGTLMPAFAQSNQGILTDGQIDSLVTYLLENPPKARETRPHS